MENITEPFSHCFWAAIFALVVVSSGVSQELGPILYTNTEKGLCSVSAEVGAKPRCIKSRFEEASWQPHGNRIVAGGPAFLDSRGRFLNWAEGGSGIRPVWTPDGRHIYAINYKLGSAVERWDAFGKNRVVIPVTGLDNPQLFLQMISFSPSEKRAAVLTKDFREMLITDVSDKALSVRKILPRGFHYVSQSVWLDEEHLLFVGKRESKCQGLWELDVQSESLAKRGIDGLCLSDSVTLSPDRNSVVVTAWREGQGGWHLWQYFFQPPRLIKLTEGGVWDEDVNPSWRH